MVSFVPEAVRVSVPASSANLGPGFDCLGLALSLRDRLEAEVTGSGLVVEVVGPGTDQVPLDETHLVVRSMHAAFDVLGGRPAGLRLVCRNAIPHARGLGSSSAAIVAGLVLARGLVVDGASLLDDEALFSMAAGIEGHPDNVGPAFYGGFVISGHEGDFFAVPSPVDPRIETVVFVPPTPVATEVARGLLPETVRHRDAAADAGRSALLVAALAGRPDQLWRATRDYLHQDFRRPAMPESLELVDALRADGVAATVSGAGPSVLALVDAADADAVAGRCPSGWLVHHLAVDREGARLEW